MKKIQELLWKCGKKIENSFVQNQFENKTGVNKSCISFVNLRLPCFSLKLTAWISITSQPNDQIN